MKTGLIIALSVLAGVFLGVVLIACRNAYIRSKRNRPRRGPKIEMTKLVIWVCLANGIAWVWFSYYLAWKEKMQIAEGLSQVAVTEIIGVVLAYCIKSAVENLSKNNRWPDKTKPPGGETDEGGQG